MRLADLLTTVKFNGFKYVFKMKGNYNLGGGKGYFYTKEFCRNGIPKDLMYVEFKSITVENDTVEIEI